MYRNNGAHQARSAAGVQLSWLKVQGKLHQEDEEKIIYLRR